MAVGQVIAIYTDRSYRRFSDDYEKLWYVPYADFEKLNHSIENRMRNASPLGTDDDREILPIASLLIPQIQAAREAQMRWNATWQHTRDRSIANVRVQATMANFPRHLMKFRLFQYRLIRGPANHSSIGWMARLPCWSFRSPTVSASPEAADTKFKLPRSSEVEVRSHTIRLLRRHCTRSQIS